jgi:hypothetical protein
MMVDDIQCTVVVYVDDLKITCVDQAIIDDVILKLQDAFKSITVKTGKIHSYLGMLFDYTNPGVVEISMQSRINDVLETFPVDGTELYPAGNSLFTIEDKAELLDKDSKAEFHSTVAKLLYIAKRTRPDVLLPVSFLTTRVQCPSVQDRRKLVRVVRYLKGTSDLSLRLTCDDPLDVKLYIDASYGVHKDYKSHTGAVLSLGNGAIMTNASKQPIVAKSSTEAEFIALSDLGSVGIWMRNFLISMGIDQDAVKIFQDNKSTIALIKNGVSTSPRTRHIGIRTYWLHDRITNKEVEVIYLPTGLMISDILTKPITGPQFFFLRNLLLNQST